MRGGMKVLRNVWKRVTYIIDMRVSTRVDELTVIEVPEIRNKYYKYDVWSKLWVRLENLELSQLKLIDMPQMSGSFISPSALSFIT